MAGLATGVTTVEHLALTNGGRSGRRSSFKGALTAGHTRPTPLFFPLSTVRPASPTLAHSKEHVGIGSVQVDRSTPPRSASGTLPQGHVVATPGA